MTLSTLDPHLGIEKKAHRWTRSFEPLLAAVQFLTRVPIPSIIFTEDTFPRSLMFFPLVGLALGALAGLLNRLLVPHLSRTLAGLAVVTFVVAVTGALHEDGLADCADAFGLRRTRERTIAILRDSRIGSFGAIAIAVSLLARVLLVSALPLAYAPHYLIAAFTLSRWSSLPLTLLPPARAEPGQGSQIAQKTSRFTLTAGTTLTMIIVFASLRRGAPIALLAASLVTVCSAIFYRRRLGGVTGDCFGATNQVVEIAVLACGAWLP